MSQRTSRITSRYIRPKANAVTAKEIVLNYLESTYEAVSAGKIFAECDWTGRKTCLVVVRKILRELVAGGFVAIIERKRHSDPNLYRFVRRFEDAEVVVKPAAPVLRELSLPIVPPRVIEFVPYVKPPEPAYRPGAFDHIKYKSKGVF